MLQEKILNYHRWKKIIDKNDWIEKQSKVLSWMKKFVFKCKLIVKLLKRSFWIFFTETNVQCWWKRQWQDDKNNKDRIQVFRQTFFSSHSIDSIKSLHNEYKFWSSYEEKLFRSPQKKYKIVQGRGAENSFIHFLHKIEPSFEINWKFLLPWSIFICVSSKL